MPEINPLTNDQIFLKKIAENTGSDYETGDVSEINPLTIDQIFLKEIAANTAGQSGDISELEGKVADNTAAIEAIVNEYGAKNFIGLIGTSTIDIPFPYTYTQRGLTFVFNEDGTVTVSGVADSTGACDAYLLAKGLSAGEYDITCPSNDLYDNKFYGIDNIVYAKVTDNNSHRVTISSTRNIAIEFYVEEGADLTTPVTFYPMIRDARIKDSTYVPYAMTNKQLTERFKVLTIPVSSVYVEATSAHMLYNNPCPTGYIPISAMFERGSVGNDSILLSVYLDSGTDVRVFMYNFSNSQILVNGSVKVLCIKA